MDDGVSRDLPDDPAELAELRRRAYASGADIAADPAALARLAELEDHIRAARQPVTPPPAAVAETAVAEPLAAPAAAGAMPATVRVAIPATSRRPPRWHSGLIAATGAVALVFSALAFISTTPEPPPVAADDPAAAAVDDSYRSTPSSAEDYAANLDYLRAGLLSGSGAEFEHIILRLDLDRLLPKGTHFGRSVWAGPTIDGDTCLVMSGEEGPFMRCVRTSEAAERGLSVVIPPGTGDPMDGSGSDVVLADDARVRYTLLPEGTVVSELVVDP